MPAGRGLQFDDDVVFTEDGYRSPYVQVRGTFPLGVLEIISTKDGPEKNTKLVELTAGSRCLPRSPRPELAHTPFVWIAAAFSLTLPLMDDKAERL